MIYKGDVGAIIRLTSSFDLSGATMARIYYTKPSGETGYWTATVYGTTAIQYTTTSEDDLDEAGQWNFQGYAALRDWTGRSSIVTDTIGKIIEAA